MEKIFKILDDHDIDFPVICRIGAGVLVLLIIIIALLNTFLPQTTESEAPEDTNVYLNEEVCYAKDIYIKVNNMSVTQPDDEESEIKYYLHLIVIIEQRTDGKPKSTKISPSNFELRAINQKAKGKLGLFF